MHCEAQQSAKDRIRVGCWKLLWLENPFGCDWLFDGRSTNKVNHGTNDHLNNWAEECLSCNETCEESVIRDFSHHQFHISSPKIERSQSLNLLSDGIAAYLHHKLSEDPEDLLECPVCCNHIPLSEFKQMDCCNIKLCSICLFTHISTNVQYGQGKIQCPSCSEEINPNFILYNSELPLTIRERYQQILARNLSEQQETSIKLCPHCNYITILDENDPRIREKKSRRSRQEWIRCHECEKDWCWPCYAPAHSNQSCQQFRKSYTQLDLWAKTRRSENRDQRNARRCPKCSVYIEKAGGCDHMLCTKCNSKFCYRCGSRMRLPYYIGHDAKYSIFGCKYKLWPNRPLLRWLIRGSVCTGVLVLTPIVLGALLCLLALGIPTILIMSFFGLPIFICLQCSRKAALFKLWT